MNFADMKTRAASLAQQDGWDSVQPAPNWPVLLNRALAMFSWEAEYQYGSYSFVTVAGQAEYTLPAPDWKRITDCAYNGVTNLYLTDETILRRENPLWHVAPNATPTKYYISNPNTIRLYPTPSASGVTVTLRGVRVDAPLVNDTDIPDCPAEPYHEGIVLLAAWLHAKQFAKTTELIAKVNDYYAEGMKHADECRLYISQQSAPIIQRNVRRVVPERISLGWFSNPQGSL